MSRLIDLLLEGGPVMIPLVGLSAATLTCALERGWFWYRLLSKEDRIVHDVLEAAQYDLDRAAAIAQQVQDLPIGRFLLAPLQLNHPTPETFRLAMESVGDNEFVQIRKGNKLLETVVGMAPLLGLLGTVTGLITTFSHLKIGGGSGTSASASQAAAGIGEALIATASGMIVAIIALAFFRIFVTLQAQQVNYFSRVGSALELIYRQVWYEPTLTYSVQPLSTSEVSRDSRLPDSY
ncbi:MAG TPA: MotA/TolQ/ExbB proton channel family protein [Chroococcales cyanobacterium]|jgi:biopolymer transport protein ExbB